MTLAKAIVGATHTPQEITWTREDGTAVNLTGATITGKIKPLNGSSRSIAGTLTITTAASGIFTWDYHANDIATAGYHLVQFKATFGSEYELSFEDLFIIDEAI